MLSAGKLRRYLNENNISLEQLSGLTGISPQNLKSILNDRSLNSSNLNILCRILKVQPCNLISYVNENEDISEIKKRFARLPKDDKKTVKEWILDFNGE